MTARLARIDIYPVKSLDGVPVEISEVLPSGALMHDRRWAMFDSDQTFVNGKRCAEVHHVRARFDLNVPSVNVRQSDSTIDHTFHLEQQQDDFAEHLSFLLSRTVSLKENRMTGFPDDTQSPGPTMISTATLSAIASWFGELSIDNVRRRFRANLEVDGVDAFWEDQLFGDAGNAVPFRIGNVSFEGVNPCQRCVVPSRDPVTGQTIPGFQKEFATRRKAELPDWAASSQFNHFYRVAVNTRIAADNTGAQLRVGDEILVNECPL